MYPRDELLIRASTAMMVLLVTSLLAVTSIGQAQVSAELRSAAAIVTGFVVGFASVASVILGIGSR